MPKEASTFEFSTTSEPAAITTDGSAATRLKALAKLTSDRKVDSVLLKEVQPRPGGVTVLGANKAYPEYVDETIEVFDLVSVSAGVRGLQIFLAPADYPRRSTQSTARPTRSTWMAFAERVVANSNGGSS